MLIRLQPYVFEDDLPRLLATLWQPLADGVLAVDFSRAVYYIPAAITVLITRLDHGMRARLKIELHGLNMCKNFRYLQRIDFFDQLGLKLQEDFKRHDAGTAFVPLREVMPGHVSIKDDPLASELAGCVADAPDGDVFQLSQYSLGEIIANLKQHACERGFVCGQYLRKRDLVCIGIADSGIGIRDWEGRARRTFGPPTVNPQTWAWVSRSPGSWSPSPTDISFSHRATRGGPEMVWVPQSPASWQMGPLFRAQF